MRPPQDVDPGTDLLRGRGRLGAAPSRDGRCSFRVWAPKAERVTLRIVGDPPGRAGPALETDLTPVKNGYFEAVVDDAPPGTRYFYTLDGGEPRPDPASRSQPEGPHGPSEVVSPEFDWGARDWQNPPMERHVFYEVHVGTFTREGTFDAIIPRLADLKDLGVTAIELMPVAQFPGARNWGYDGVGLFAAQNTYGGPLGLKRLVDAAHGAGLAVVLDVVYNHLGPEGNHLGDFGDYFTDRFKTPWGPAINFDGRGSDHVRDFFIQNALYWTVECRLDGLRIDAVHAIFDTSAMPFLEELADAVHREAEKSGRRILVIAESDLNDPRIVRPPSIGGFGLDAQWADDFHHAILSALAGEKSGYAVDYGGPARPAKAYTDGFVYTGELAEGRGRRHGRPAPDLHGSSFVVFIQNHDQVGNRPRGDRVVETAGFEGAKCAAAACILSPYVPLLFMGEEYGEEAPFLYFVSHGDERLVEAVRRGRHEEFARFDFAGAEFPDPQSEETFRRSVLRWHDRGRGRHALMLDLYRGLLRLRRAIPAFADLSREGVRVAAQAGAGALTVLRRAGDDGAALCLNFGAAPAEVPPPGPGRWSRLLDTADTRYGGPGVTTPDTLAGGPGASLTLAPRAAAVFHRRSER